MTLPAQDIGRVALPSYAEAAVESICRLWAERESTADPEERARLLDCIYDPLSWLFGEDLHPS